MAIYRLPPAPFVGGRQPLDNRDLSAAETGVPVHEPPYQGSVRSAQILSIILLAWIPPPAQPQVAWKVNPAIEAVQEDRPPVSQRSWLVAVLSAWELGAEHWIVSRRVPIEEVLVGAPVLRLLDQVALREWAADPAWRFERRINPAILAVPEDSPPFEQQSFVQRVLIRQVWEPGPPIPWTGWRVNPALLAVPEDNPPFGQRLWLSGIFSAWEPNPPVQIVLRYVPIEGVVAEAPVLSSRSWLPLIISQWHLEQFKPQISWKLSVSFLAVSEDDPPFNQRSNAQRASIRSTWEPGLPVPWFGWNVSPFILAVPEDAPPFSQRTRVWRVGVRQAWEPGPPVPWSGWPVNSAILAVPEDDPPFDARRLLLSANVRQAWTFDLLAPIVRRHAPIEAAVVELPVFNLRRWLGALSSWEQLSFVQLQVAWRINSTLVQGFSLGRVSEFAVQRDNQPSLTASYDVAFEAARSNQPSLKAGD